MASLGHGIKGSFFVLAETGLNSSDTTRRAVSAVVSNVTMTVPVMGLGFESSSTHERLLILKYASSVRALRAFYVQRDDWSGG